jgi:hypothetical protein
MAVNESVTGAIGGGVEHSEVGDVEVNENSFGAGGVGEVHFWVLESGGL